MPKSETFDRHEVLEKITNLFWLKGYNGTSIQNIVDASGLNRSSLYNSFGDKYQLFTESLGYYCEHVQSVSLSDVEKLTPKNALKKIFEGVLSAINDKMNHKGCFLTNSTAELAAHDTRINHFLHDNMENVTSLFGDILENGIKMGDFNENLDVRETALYLFSSIQGIRVTGMLIQSKKEMKELIDRTLDSI